MPKKSPRQKKSINLAAFFNRFHAVIFTVVIGGGLAAAVFALMTVVDTSDAANSHVPTSTDTSFDTATIKRVEKLRPLSTAPTPPQLPSGRIDPFPQ